MILVNCCGTCIHSEYQHKKGKTLRCHLFDLIAHQFQICDCHQQDRDKLDRINSYIKTLDK